MTTTTADFRLTFKDGIIDLCDDCLETLKAGEDIPCPTTEEPITLEGELTERRRALPAHSTALCAGCVCRDEAMAEMEAELKASASPEAERYARHGRLDAQLALND